MGTVVLVIALEHSKRNKGETDPIDAAFSEMRHNRMTFIQRWPSSSTCKSRPEYIIFTFHIPDLAQHDWNENS